MKIFEKMVGKVFPSRRHAAVALEAKEVLAEEARSLARDYPLCAAIESGQWDRANALLAEDPSRHAEVAGRWAFTPLTRALERAGEPECETMVRLLLGAGADASKANAYGISPLGQAIGAGNPGLVDLLLGHGARLDLENCDENPLWLALVAKTAARDAICWRLLAAGADPDFVMTLPDDCRKILTIQDPTFRGRASTPRRAANMLGISMDVVAAWNDFVALDGVAGDSDKVQSGKKSRL
jgi:hypothetical protein